MSVLVRNFVIAVGLAQLLSLCPTASGQTLQASVALGVNAQNQWNYTLTNSEPATSTNWLTEFYLPINAPVIDITAPNNWYVSTDDTTYVDWANVEMYPYPDDIAPGLSVSGFGFTSVATGIPVQYSLASWDHAADAPGSETIGNILSPAEVVAVPEPSALSLLALGLMALALPAMRARRRRAATQ